MDEISCPMCGKANPKELDICQFCQARLKPLLASPAQSEGDPGIETPMQSGFLPPEESSEQDLDLPDWLRELRGIESKPSEESPSDEPLPDWSETEIQEPQEGRTPNAVPEKEDWLEGLRENGDVKTSSFSDEQRPLWEDENSLSETDVEEEPNWLQRIRARHQADVEPEKLPVDTSSKDDVPGWQIETDSGGFNETPSSTLSMEESELPDWLKKLDTPATERSGAEAGRVEENTQTSPPAGNVPALIFDENELFPFLSEEQPAPARSAEVEHEEEFASGVSQEEEGHPVEKDKEGLATAQIPSWLEAMRPVEIGAPSSPIDVDEDREPERAGPLAGLRGVLPAESGILRIRKPPVYSIKLQLTESQQANAALLQDLIASETEARPIQGRPSISSPYILRLVIGIAIFVILGWTLWPGTIQSKPPNTRRISPEIADAYRLSSSLPAGVPVLLVFDYQPRLSGEINDLASSMASQLARSGVYLVTASTSPAGTLLAQGVLNSVQDRFGELRFSNLGFLPGGISGIAGFVRSPEQVLPYDISGAKAWEAGSLIGIRRLSDFALIVIFTDDAAVAQSWIEQLHPSLQASNKSLIMLTSAQVEPVIRPYYESIPKQVNGLVSGLAGAAALERLNGQSGQATLQWNVLGTGLSVVVVIILLGALYSLLSTRLVQLRTVRSGGKNGS